MISLCVRHNDPYPAVLFAKEENDAFVTLWCMLLMCDLGYSRFEASINTSVVSELLERRGRASPFLLRRELTTKLNLKSRLAPPNMRSHLMLKHNPPSLLPGSFSTYVIRPAASSRVSSYQPRCVPLTTGSLFNSFHTAAVVSCVRSRREKSHGWFLAKTFFKGESHGVVAPTIRRKVERCQSYGKVT